MWELNHLRNSTSHCKLNLRINFMSYILDHLSDIVKSFVTLLLFLLFILHKKVIQGVRCDRIKSKCIFMVKT